MILRRRTKMFFKFGVTCIVGVAVLVYYYGENHPKEPVEVEPGGERGQVNEELQRNQQLTLSSRGDNLIHICVVVCGDRKEEAVTMIKSAILWPRSQLRFHIFAEDHLQQPIRDKFDIWPQEFRDKFDYVFYPITFPGQSNQWRQLFKPCSSQRLFLPALLMDIDALLYVDTDVIFLRPVDDVWHHFTRFNSSHLAALTPESQDIAVGWYNHYASHPFYGQTGVNSGVMLMNLTRMRNFGWIPKVTQYYRKYKLALTFGDQDIINIIFHYYPDKLYVYSCDWNYRPDHCMYMSVCEVAEHVGVSVLHGNRGVWHGNLQPAFRAVYDAFHEHRLGADVQYSLLDAMTNKLDDTAKTNCGKVRQIFTKQFEKQIPDYRRRKMEWLLQNSDRQFKNGPMGFINVTRAVSFTDFVRQRRLSRNR